MVFKRTLSVSPSPSKINENKSNACKVCGHHARFINYGALSCQPCKIFFRRHAFHPEVFSLYRIFLMNIILFFQ